MYRKQLTLALLLTPLALLVATDAVAQCVDTLAPGDVVLVDLLSDTSVIRIDDVSTSANPASNQSEVCTGGSLQFPRSLDFDREGRIWVTDTNGVVRVTPIEDDQRQLLLNAPPTPYRGIGVDDTGNLLIADPGLTVAEIRRLEPINGGDFAFSPVGASSAPLGLIFDPSPGADPNDLLIADFGNFQLGLTSALLFVDGTNGQLSGIARNGYLGSSYRLASQNGNFVYLTDHGGLVDPDGDGPLEPVARGNQIVRVDRSIPFDFSDAEADGTVNQTVITTGGELVFPIGIVVLDDDGVNPDTLLVADADAHDGDGAVIRIDFDPNPPPGTEIADTAVQTIIARGQDFEDPWGLRIVGNINPLPVQRIYVTDADALPADSGVVFIDPPPASTNGDYVSNIEMPTGIVVDPFNTTDLLVANAGTPAEILRVTPATPTTGTASPITSGGMLTNPVALIVDSNSDILVLNRDGTNSQVIAVDATTGTQTLLSPLPGEENFFLEPTVIAVDGEGFVLVADDGDDNFFSRVIRIDPLTGQQFCTLDGSTFPIDLPRDIIFDGNGAVVFSQDASVPIFRQSGAAVFAESISNQYRTPRGTAIAENLDILTVDANNESTLGDGRVLRLDPIGVATNDAPEIVPGSEMLADPFGIAVEGLPRPNPPPSDLDGDGVLDPLDNCVTESNPGQEFPTLLDANGDPDELATAANRLGSVCFGLCPTNGCSCDVNDNGSVGIDDFLLLLDQFGDDCTVTPVPESGCTADCEVARDAIVGLDDFSALLAQLGQTTPTSTPGALVKSAAAENCPENQF